MTEDEVYEHFMQAVREAGGQRKFAENVNFTSSYINDIVHKRRLISEKILERIGIERIVTITYRKINSR